MLAGAGCCNPLDCVLGASSGAAIGAAARDEPLLLNARLLGGRVITICSVEGWAGMEMRRGALQRERPCK